MFTNPITFWVSYVITFFMDYILACFNSFLAFVQYWQLTRVFQPITGTVTIIYELLLPAFGILLLILNALSSLLFGLLMAPFTLLAFVLRNVLDTFYMVFNTLFFAFAQCKRMQGAFWTVAKPENTETTRTVLQICLDASYSWGQSLAKKVILSFKAVYDFIVYVGSEIGKH